MPKKILLIEDEGLLSEMYEEKLKEEGFEVISVTEARDGLRLAKKEKPDLILLDILLPRENGIEFLMWLKEDPELSFIPVLVFSNFDDPETKKKAFHFGAKEYLIKTNYTPKEVVEKIKNYLK